MVVAPNLLEAIDAQWILKGEKDYPAFESWLRDFARTTGIPLSEISGLLRTFYDRNPAPLPDWRDPETTSVFRDPPDPGPLSSLSNHGWITDAQADAFRLDDDALRDHVLRDVSDIRAAKDIQENALHVLGRCNNPNAWGKDNRRGLVYGMVQSGKTANMLSLIALAKHAGYRLVILLAGDKSSLRDQSQLRVNTAFDLRSGTNEKQFLNSPTYDSDYLGTDCNYEVSFMFRERVVKGVPWTSIIVIKKQKQNLEALIGDIEAMSKRLRERYKRGLDDLLPTLIIDDEADYGTMDTDPPRGIEGKGKGSEIHNLIVKLRAVIPRNSYIGYTATPQACLSARVDDQVGYPKDFFWLVEPYQVIENGLPTSKTYLGAYDVFWEYGDTLIRTIGRDEWPHHEKDERGRSLGVYAPPTSAQSEEEARQKLVREESRILGSLERGERPFPALQDALMDFMLGCGVRWWRTWARKGRLVIPSDLDVDEDDDYKHHAAMIHLSKDQENQSRIRDFVQKEWKKVVRLYQEFERSGGKTSSRFRARWESQCERIAQYRRPENVPTWQEVAPFVGLCVKINERPILNHSEPGYPAYEGDPFVYLLQSTEKGMELFYGKNKPTEVRTKKAAIVVGGNILSRGLTIEGLCVSVYGRTAGMPLGDATLQMGRWLGHKKPDLDLISIYMQKGVRELFQQVAVADRHLRLQIKDAITNGVGPEEILLELRNSPFFRATSPSKSRFLENDGGGFAFAGQTTWLDSPSFEVDDILENGKAVEAFVKRAKSGALALDRAMLYKNVDPQAVIELLERLRCPPESGPATFAQFSSYLKDWRRGGEGLPAFPRINLAVFIDLQERQRVLDPLRPLSEKSARSNPSKSFTSIIGGLGTLAGYGRKYRGDAFLDKDVDWHRSHENPSTIRQRGEEILIVLYRLHPNYLTRTLFEEVDHKIQRQGKSEKVYAKPGTPYHVAKSGLGDKDLPLWSFAAWTPVGGPLYQVGINRFIAEKPVKMRGRVRIGAEIADEEAN